jgi:hypothetical protein
MEANKNFAKWLSCGIQISGTFGLHHVLCHAHNIKSGSGLLTAIPFFTPLFFALHVGSIVVAFSSIGSTEVPYSPRSVTSYLWTHPCNYNPEIFTDLFIIIFLHQHIFL